MSVRVMSTAWAVALPAGDKLVLLALADCANDEGRCWPGIKSLCAKTGKCERSLQASLKALEEAEQITREQIAGKGCNYTIHPQPILALVPSKKCAPAKSAPPQKFTKPPAEIAGKPSRTLSSEAKASSHSGEQKIALKPEQLQEAWNLGPAERGAIEAKRLGPERRQKMNTFLKRYSVDEITEAINAVAESDFLCGRTKEGFRADIDFLFSPKHMNRLLEGFYGRQSAA